MDEYGEFHHRLPVNEEGQRQACRQILGNEKAEPLLPEFAVPFSYSFPAWMTDPEGGKDG
jgi:hypothetical protein